MLEPNDFNITQCNQVVTAKGMYIEDLYNTSQRLPMTFVMNVYTVSIFTKDTPDSLLDSIDLAFVSDVRFIEGAPECVVIQSKIENKNLIPCFEQYPMKALFVKAFEIFKKCQQGKDITPPLTECEKEAAEKAKKAGKGKDDKKEEDKKEFFF